MIESAAQIIEDVPGDDRKALRDRLYAGNKIDQVSRFRIALGGYFIGAGIDEGLNCGFEVLDMFVGPINFWSNERKSFISGYKFPNTSRPPGLANAG